jgi:PAS domain S-box-containing protein
MAAQVEHFASGTVVIRRHHVVYASEGVATLLARPAAEIAGRPFLEFIALEERARIAERHERRIRGEPAPAEYETVFVRPDGSRRVVEIHATLDAEDVVLQLRDVSVQAARRPRLEGLAALGAAIQREQTEAAIFARVREGLAGVGLIALLLRAEAEGGRVEWAEVPAPLRATFEARTGRALEGFRGRWTGFSRTVWDEGGVYSDDWGGEVASYMPHQEKEARALVAHHRLSRAIAVRLDEQAGLRFYLVLAGEWLRVEDQAAVRLFGAQVAAALDAARAIADLSRHNADLSALNRIGELVGEAGDLDTFFRRADEIVRQATACAGLAIFALDDGGGQLALVHDAGVPPEGRARLRRVPAASPLGDVLRERLARVVELDGARQGADLLEGMGVRTAAWIPLVARSKLVGVMAVGFSGAPDAVRARLDLLGAAGAHFASAMESHGLLADLRRRVSELTLLNDVAVASAQLDPVLLLENALRRVCETFRAEVAAAYMRDGERLVLVATVGLRSDSARRVAQLQVGEGICGQAVQRLAPVRWDRENEAAVDAVVSAAEQLSSAVAMPLLAKGHAAVGAIAIGRRTGPAIEDGELSLLSAVAAQLGVAVENARLFDDVRRRLSDLEAIHALALRIFGNAPGDVRALLEDGCRESARALACRGGMILLTEDGGRRLRGAAGWGVPLDPTLIEIPISADPLSVEAIARRAPAWSEDVTKDPRSAMYGRPGVPPLSMLAIPLTSRTETAGVLFLADDAGRRFTDPELALANALAGELAVGLENARLYAEARQRLAELSTVIDVARVVSSSLDLEEVLLAGAEHLRRTLAASACTILLDDFRSQELRRAASHGPPIGPPRIPLADPSLGREALEARAPVTGRLPGEGAGSEVALLAVPLHVRDQPVGVALVAGSAADRTFSPGELSRAMAIASQLAVAVDNARLYSETRRRAEELGLLHEVGRSLVATLDIEQVLDTGVRNLARMVDAPAALLGLVTADGKEVELRAVSGAPTRLVGLRLALQASDPAFLHAIHTRREPLIVEDTAADPRLRKDILEATGARAYLTLPLLVRDRVIGIAIIVETRGPRLFGPAEVERAAAIANQLAVAAENARLYEDLRRSYAELAHAQRQLIHQERLAALGELSAVVAHEVRNPLGVIFNSLGSLRRLIRPQGDAKMLLDIVGEEADRLNRIVGDLLDFARPSTPVLQPELLGHVVDEAVAAALAQNPAGVEVCREREPGDDLPAVPLDARLVRQAVVNLAVNAVQAMPRGGRLTVRVRRDAEAARLEIEDTGPGIPEEVRSRIFEPFFTTKASGTGLGLAVVKRIVDGHGGEIAVRSRPGAGTVFSLSFPLTSGPAPEGVEKEATLG